ncbi:Purine nucleoside phosphorylase DeoD-type [Photobacterium damselae subsp. piscicida]|uniref:Purine nucleoside phosphorylase DeoD-type n=1 Tax=Photobacterium damsela subsp. piscicida TaxID=38294 RepID=A0A1V1VFX5_PHODP|nr:purine-nucleoside phosphorylase [Photobacterium damselae]MBE8126631.1 purine-nucleoside phosphorylase [Photobacterium damselae subsp. piscicida]PSV66181.1 purine-nucleoside phosphorylase [Photobacterium damselae]PSW76713.1 purine-nucleoside phosphorylase [Photobacterium damselae]QOD54564.1 purine-nucleoside phosphorylase [Photobacterium damselae subsp. piscicida]QOD58778.1 purine-nucleoside phosphorylase [Photobacterium damselae subsp. piscicida]
MATPHINVEFGDFAETVLMPGDPLRAKFIAETYLEDAKEVCNVRNMFGYTGTYKGHKISVMGHGMGIPSCSIYVHELIKDFGVKNVIRIGSCGAVHDDVKLMDVIIGMGASTDSKVNRIRFNNHDFAAIADFHLLETAVNQARSQNVPVRVGNVFSADLFYSPEVDLFDKMEKLGILGVDMEAAGIYGVAAELGAKALTILTVSDHIKRGEKLSSEDRQKSFNDMMNVALETAVNL